jgi:hypothetical protein
MNVSAAAQAAAAVAGWHMVDGNELALDSALLSNGLYSNVNAQAIVAVADYDGHRTLAIGFQDSNDAQDWRENFQNINSHYLRYEPLIAGIDAAVGAGRYDLVLVSGHSLGGAMAQMFVAGYANIAPVYGITTGAPGYLQPGPVFDDRIINYQITDDPVIILGDNRAQVGQILASLGPATLTALATTVGNALGFPADVITSSVPFMTQNYYDWGANVILPVPGHPAAPPPVQSLLLGVNVDAHDFATYNANIDLVDVNPFDLGVGGRGTEDDDALFGTTGNDVLDGGHGTDVLYLHANRTEFSVVKTAGGFTVTSAASGSDSISGVERVQFPDARLALDLDSGQAAGNTVRIIGAALDAPAIQQHPDYVGIGLQLFDAGLSMLQVCELVAQQVLRLGDADFVNTVYTNVVGVAPATAERDFFVGLLQGSGGALTQGQLLELAANSDPNLSQIDFVGLQQTGVEYS